MKDYEPFEEKEKPSRRELSAKPTQISAQKNQSSKLLTKEKEQTKATTEKKAGKNEDVKSFVRVYVNNEKFREQFVSEDKQLGKSKIEINKLRMQTGHMKFLIEKESVQKYKENQFAKEEPNYYQDFIEKERMIEQQKIKADQMKKVLQVNKNQDNMIRQFESLKKKRERDDLESKKQTLVSELNYLKKFVNK